MRSPDQSFAKTEVIFVIKGKSFMRRGFSSVIALGIGTMLAAPAFASTIYNNLTPNNMIAIASRPDTGTPFEIEAADDFVLTSHTIIDSASFVGLIVPAAGAGTPSISDLVVEMYRVFPADSNVARTSGPPTFSTPEVPTRVNSPSDNALDSRDSAAASLTFTSTQLSATFTALNSIAPGGIHPIPLQTTGGNGPQTGQEVRIDVTFTTPFDLQAAHLFFVPQVALTNGGQFYWLSADRPITGAGGTTPFPTGVTDLQAWTRDDISPNNLAPDWLRVGGDIVGPTPTTGPTFNAAFSLSGTALPEPSSILLTTIGLVTLIGVGRFWRPGR
jgi:hypothetical protein